MGNKNDKVVNRNDGVDGLYSKKTLDNGSTVETLSRRHPDNTVTYTERFITTPPQSDTSYYIYQNVTPPIDRYVPARRYVTPTKYDNMWWLGKRVIGGVRPESWDKKFDSYQNGGVVANDNSINEQITTTQNNAAKNIANSFVNTIGMVNPLMGLPTSIAAKVGNKIGNTLADKTNNNPDMVKNIGTTLNRVGAAINPMFGAINVGAQAINGLRDNANVSDSEQAQSFQEGGAVPSANQQELFVAILTDMASVLGVEPSQELAKAVMTAFENNDDSQGLITLFTQIKDKRMKETGLFKQGGKMDTFVEKFKCGGKTSQTKKKQSGGELELTRGEARLLSKLNKGYSNDTFRTAYQNAKYALSNNTDLRGREKRMAARRMVAGVSRPVTQTSMPVEQTTPNTPTLNIPTPTLSKPAEIKSPVNPTVTPTNTSNTYTVKKGDTISQIVADYNKNNPGANLK